MPVPQSCGDRARKELRAPFGIVTHATWMPGTKVLHTNFDSCCRAGGAGRQAGRCKPLFADGA